MSGTSLPVTVVISRTPVAGREADLVAWAEGVSDVAATFPGHLGASIYPPGSVDGGDLVLVFSFEDADQLKAWEQSRERADWLARSKDLVVGEMRTHSVSGFEGIFSHVPGKPVVPPPRWKTATIIALALYPMSLVLNWLVVPHVVTWNIFLRVLLTTLIIVPYMAWLGVPYLSRWLRSWLHP